jgi:hypothetical protein
MVTARIFVFMYCKFNMVVVCPIGKYAQNWITDLYDY